jgi:hypothetical protein
MAFPQTSDIQFQPVERSKRAASLQAVCRSLSWFVELYAGGIIATRNFAGHSRDFHDRVDPDVRNVSGPGPKRREIPMIRMIIMMKRKEGLSKEEFRQHYEESHSKLGMRFFGNNMHNYTRMYIMEDPGDGSGKVCPFDSITTVEFDDWDAINEFNRIYELPHVKKIMNEDEDKFVDMENSCAMVVEVHKNTDEETRRAYEPQG